ncbi:MAG: hypothetical protein V1746_01325, partial [bacterium]
MNDIFETHSFEEIKKLARKIAGQPFVGMIRGENGGGKTLLLKHIEEDFRGKGSGGDCVSITAHGPEKFVP